jgi:hypothetical protein
MAAAVTQHQQAPAVAEGLDRHVDRHPERAGSRILLLLAWKLVAVTIAMPRLPVVKCNRMTG